MRRLLLLVCLYRLHALAKVIILTDENFDEKVAEGSWLVEAYSPWCHLCKELDPVWERLAEELEGEVYVAKFDVTQQGVLRRRFGIRGVPSIFHLKEGNTREYSGNRSFKDLLQFARTGWQTVEPYPFYQAPNSAFGKVFGQVLGLPKAAGQTYMYLNTEKGYSDLTLLGLMLAVPISIGLSAICALDAYYSRRAGQPDHAHQH